MSSSVFILKTLITKSSSHLLHSSIDYTCRSTILNSKLSSISHLRSLLRNAHQREQTKSSSSLMRYRLSEFDETQLSNLISSLMRFDEIHFVKFDEMLLIRNDEMSLVSSLMSRPRHVWWVALVKAFVISKKLESDNRNIDDEIIKHDHENEFTKISLQERKSEVAFLDHISHFETRRKTRY
jgi:hypothetical protein